MVLIVACWRNSLEHIQVFIAGNREVYANLDRTRWFQLLDLAAIEIDLVHALITATV